MGQSRHVIEVRGNDLRATMELGLALARLIEASGGTAELNQAGAGITLNVECNAVWIRTVFEEAILGEEEPHP